MSDPSIRVYGDPGVVIVRPRKKTIRLELLGGPAKLNADKIEDLIKVLVYERTRLLLGEDKP